MMLGMGIGWVLGITLALTIVSLSSGGDFYMPNVLGNLFVLSFPGIILMLVAFIFSIKEGDKNPYKGEY